MTNDPYSPIAEIYDFSYDGFDEDVDFYENLARAGSGSVLELGVGSGRVAVPLAAHGYKVTGIDTSESMLEKARVRAKGLRMRKGGGIELLTEDMTAFDLGKRFDLVLCAANTFQHMLTTDEQRAALQCAVQHLEPGGIFAMSIRSPASVDWDEAGLPAPLLLDWVRDDPDTGDQIMKFVAAQPDPGRMTRRMTYVYDRVRADGEVRRSVFVTDLRYSTQAELTLLLQQVGLRVTHVYGDYDLCPVGEGDNLVFVARAEGSR